MSSMLILRIDGKAVFCRKLQNYEGNVRKIKNYI